MGSITTRTRPRSQLTSPRPFSPLIILSYRITEYHTRDPTAAQRKPSTSNITSTCSVDPIIVPALAPGHPCALGMSWGSGALGTGYNRPQLEIKETSPEATSV